MFCFVFREKLEELRKQKQLKQELGTQASEYFRGLDNSVFTLVQLFTFDSNLPKFMGS